MKKAKPTNKKEPAKKARTDKYDPKLAVTGSFLDIMKAAAKDANGKNEPKKP